MDDAEEEKRTYNILVFGIDKLGFTLPEKSISDRNFVLHFEAYDTRKKFYEYDVLIVFKGIFEEFSAQNGTYGTYVNHKCDTDELDKRKKELDLLLSKGGIVCFILAEPFLDAHRNENYEHTDLVKFYLNHENLYRKNFPTRVTHLTSKTNEFKKFFDLYGAAWTYFENYDDDIEIKSLATFRDHEVGMILDKTFFVLPSLKPQGDEIIPYFTLIGEALASTKNKLITELPAWAAKFIFQEEKQLFQEKALIQKKVTDINDKLHIFEKFKKILTATDDELVGSVKDVFQNGFGFPIDEKDEYKEDLKILDHNGKPMILIEVKGVNKSVQRAHINQADTHRERANLAENFPSILIMNTHVKNARTLEEKDQPIANEQIVHAVKMNVLVLRSLDLLLLLDLFLKKGIDKENVLKILTSKSGWLRFVDNKIEITTEPLPA